MKLATIQHMGKETSAVITPEGAITVDVLNRTAGVKWPLGLLEIIQSGLLEEMSLWWRNNGKRMVAQTKKDIIPFPRLKYLPPYRDPSKIWGFGLNYREHAADLSENVLDSIPGSFMKPSTTIIGYREPIVIPALSEKTTAEGELGLIIGKKMQKRPERSMAGRHSRFHACHRYDCGGYPQENHPLPDLVQKLRYLFQLRPGYPAPRRGRGCFGLEGCHMHKRKDPRGKQGGQHGFSSGFSRIVPLGRHDPLAWRHFIHGNPGSRRHKR
jgi:hypothetical protein